MNKEEILALAKIAPDYYDQRDWCLHAKEECERLAGIIETLVESREELAGTSQQLNTFTAHTTQLKHLRL